MVVRRGQNWGSTGTPDSTTPVAMDDAHASRLIEHGVREFVLASGDLARTVGATSPTPTSSYRRLPIDLMRISLLGTDGYSSRHFSMSHCLIRQRFSTGGVLRGRVSVICNAQYVHGHDVAPRGHPNDGKVEIVDFSKDLSIRQRLLVLRRSRTGDHLPHPMIQVRQVSEPTEWNAEGVVVIDGRRIGWRIVEGVELLCDEVIIWAASPSGAFETQD